MDEPVPVAVRVQLLATEHWSLSSGFGTAFHVLSIGLASLVLVLGTLTGIRVTNASVDDHALLPALTAVLGCLAAALYFGIALDVSRRTFAHPHLDARFPSP
jgi:hypothetical protein